MGEGLVPTGEIRDVTGTPFDFREPKTIGRDIGMNYEQLDAGNGYDHNFCINGYKKELRLAATVTAPNGVRLDCLTDLPGMQLYVGNFLEGKIGKNNTPMDFRTGFCLETGRYPDTPNHSDFPGAYTAPGKEYISNTTFRLRVK